MSERFNEEDAGYNSVVEFVENVAKNYEIIREGIERDGHQTYMLQLKDKHNNTLMVELSGDGIYWNINTAGIFKTSYGKNRKEVYNRYTTVKQSTETAEVSQGTELSGTQAPSSIITPTTSSDTKDTTNLPIEKLQDAVFVTNSSQSPSAHLGDITNLITNITSAKTLLKSLTRTENQW